MIGNIFLDFFNRDSREIFGLFGNLSREKHIQALTEAATIAAFLCAEHCVLPPGFLAECELAREAIIRRPEYLVDRLFRLPLREETLDFFWEKKRREYYPFRNKYAGLFDHRNEVLLRRFSGAIISRNSKIADELLRTWEQGPDTNSIWRGMMPQYNASQIEAIREVPRHIRDEGAAVTWPAIYDRVQRMNIPNSLPLRYILQNHYFDIYLREYGLTVLTRLPFARVAFVSGTSDLTNDYESLKVALSTLSIWEVVRNLSAGSMLSLRSKPGFYDFRRVFDLVAHKAPTTWDVGLCFARAASRARMSNGLRKIIRSYRGGIVPICGYELNDSELHAIGERLGKGRSAEREVLRITETLTKGGTRSMTSSTARVIAVFVALEMERRVLVTRWKLTQTYPDPVWHGKLNDVEISLYGPDEMGRVSAAVETMRFLGDNRAPDLLIVTGIAGGFERESVRRGDILIATSVADLASRKIRGSARVIPEFRPREFRTDERLSKYVRSGSFDRAGWEQAVISEAEWPEGLRPTIHHGTVASLDEVVSSAGWVETLCTAWPKLLGVEMEAGGVCAAAVVKGVPFAVVRGVSDVADPAKSDDEWRRRAIKTVAHLLENVIHSQLLGG